MNVHLPDTCMLDYLYLHIPNTVSEQEKKTRAQFYVIQQRIDKTGNLLGYAYFFTDPAWAGFLTLTLWLSNIFGRGPIFILSRRCV